MAKCTKAKMISFDPKGDIDGMYDVQKLLKDNGIRVGDTGYMTKTGIRRLQIPTSQVDDAVTKIKKFGFDVVNIKDDIDLCR